MSRRISLGLSLAGIVVIAGFITMIWSFWIGAIITIIGLIWFIPEKNRRFKPPG